MMRLCRSAILTAICLAAGADRASAQTTTLALQDLKKLSLEELAQIDVTSASRRSERLSTVPAAVSVVRREDIMRAGTTILAEAMRLGDGVDVARVNGGTWAVSMRGFNISTANKVLVLVDGRSTYSPLFSGTFWDVQDILLADLDRIEFIRGPGGATWGANAVNGVINVISRPVAETQGSVLTVIGGTDELPLVSGRYGAALGSGHYRVYAKYRRRDAQVTSTGASADDAVRFGQAGFRFDSDQTRLSRWTVSGAGYLGAMAFANRPDGEVSGGHLLVKWNRRTATHGQFEVRGYYDRTNRMVPMQFEEHRNAGDLDGQYEFRAGRHSVVTGAQLHLSSGTDVGTAGFFFEPEHKRHWLTTVFVQDQIELARDRAYVIAGAKIGANDFTGAEVLPTVRLRLHPNARHMVWGAISRAVRLPTRFDTELRLRNTAGVVTITGTEDFDSESVVAYEAGYRAQPHPRVLADVSVFANRYDSLRSQELRFVPTPRIFLENAMNADTHGVEVGATVQPSGNWRLHGSYAWLKKTLTFDPGSTDPTKGVFEANDPAHLASLRSQLDLPAGFALDAFLRRVGKRVATPVPAYTELDLRLGWRVKPYWELSLVGQNLLDDRHQEFNFTPPIEFRRAAFLRSIWEF
jgi:iron complex outermembrane recepter protein